MFPTRKYACKASSKLRDVLPAFVTSSSTVSSLPKAARSTKRNSAGHHFLAATSLSLDMVTLIVPATSAIESSCQAFVRTTPWSGASGLSALCANQGKQIGIPPRIACPSSQRDCELRKSTSSSPAGLHEVTCPPCRYISAIHAGEVIRTLRSPLFP